MVTDNYSISFNNNYITIPSTSNFSFGTGDFTVEAWVNNFAVIGGGVTFDQVVFGGYSASSPAFLCFLNNSDNAPCFWDGATQYTSSISVPQGVWTHVAWVRNDYTLRIFVNGQIGLTAYTYVKSFSTASTWYIGRNDTAADRYFSGNISNLRVIKGTGLYNSDFSTQLQTQPFSPSAVSGTVLLVGQYTSVSASITDTTGLNTLTSSTPAPTVSPSNPFMSSNPSVFRVTPSGDYYTFGELDEYTLSVSPPSLSGTTVKAYSNGVLQTNGPLDEYTITTTPPSKTGTVIRQCGNGSFQVRGNGFDEVSPNIFGGKILSYNFNVTANASVNNSGLCDVIVSFLGTTITANSGGYASGITGGAAGLFSITTDGLANTGGANGGAGSNGFGGTSGGPGGPSIGNGARDISGLFTFLTAEGTYSTASFGAGGGGGPWMGGGSGGQFAGGAAGGSGAGGGGYVRGGLAAFLLQYTCKNVNYYQIFTQPADQITSTFDYVTFPLGTTYVKCWAIGKGGMSGMSGTFTQYSAGAGGSAGTAYAEFSATTLGNLISNYWQQ
jgi:hypothetical protein